MAVKRQRTYPRLTAIKDQDIQQSLRLLWDKVFDTQDSTVTLTGSLDDAHSLIESQATTIKQLNAQVIKLSAGLGVDQPNNPPGIPTTPEGGNPTPGGNPNQPPSGGDGGQGQLGCANSGANGHLDPGFPVTPESAGKIICGVGKEFPALLAVTVDQPTRDSNRDELMNRMVWHLNVQGFPASRYHTPGGYPWHILFNVAADQYSYRVLDYTADDYTQPITTTMVFGGRTNNYNTTPDGGTPD